MSYTIKLLSARPRIVVLVLFVLGSALQVLFAKTWLPHSDFLLNQGTPAWVSGSLYTDLLAPGLWLRLPSFYDVEFNAYLKHPPNYVFVLLGLLLVASGWLWQRGSAGLTSMVWVVFLSLSIGTLVSVPPVLSPMSRPGNSLPTQAGVGFPEGQSMVATEGESKEGYLIFGPVAASMPTGSYRVTLEYESSGALESPVAQWDVVLGSKPEPVVSGSLPPSTENGGEFRRKFSLKEALSPDGAPQLRVLYPGRGNLSVERLTITPLDVATEL